MNNYLCRKKARGDNLIVKIILHHLCKFLHYNLHVYNILMSSVNGINVILYYSLAACSYWPCSCCKNRYTNNSEVSGSDSE